MSNALRKMLLGKIHRATVTMADGNYEGSITVDGELLAQAGILAHEAVVVWNATNGERFETYAIPGEPGSGVVCVNGAAAHLVSRGDKVIVACFGWLEEAVARDWQPRVVFVDDRNRMVDPGRREIPGPATPAAAAAPAVARGSEGRYNRTR